jgi:hypothetical protein
MYRAQGRFSIEYRHLPFSLVGFKERMVNLPTLAVDPGVSRALATKELLSYMFDPIVNIHIGMVRGGSKR